MPQRHGVQFTVVLPNLKTGRLAGLDFVQDAVVGVLQCGCDNLGEAVAVLAHGVDARPQPGRLRGREKLGRLGAVIFVGAVHLVEQEQVAQMKKTSLGFFEVDIGAAPVRVGAAVVKKRPVAALGLSHHIGV